MPNNQKKSKEVAEGKIVESVPRDTPRPQVNETMQAGMMQIFGDQEPYRPTKSQVDKLLALQEKGMDYTHKERTMYQPKQILDFAAFVVVLVFVIGLLFLIIYCAPQYTSQAISSLLGLIGGGGIGYGFGVRKKNHEED